MRKTPHLGWLLAASAVCLVGWLMFATHLDGESLWYDEWFTWEISRQGLLGSVTTTAADVHPPFYYLWVWGWMTWTQSDDVLVMRLTSVIPAVLAVAMAYRLGRDWFRNRWFGLTAAAFLATSGIFIYYARELRMYSLVALLGLGSWWLLWRYLKGHQRSLVGYAVLVALLMYTYYFTAFMIAVQALIALITAPRRMARILLAYGAALIAFAPWLPTVYQQLIMESVRAGRGATLSLTNIGKFAAHQPTNAQTVQQFIQIYTAGQPAYFLLLALLAFTFAYAKWRRPLTAITLWLVVTTLLFFGINLVIPVYNLRYVLMVVPAAALLVGVGLAALPARRSYRVAFVGLVMGVGVITHTAGFLDPKGPHHELMQTLEQHYQPGDRIWYNLDDGARGSNLLFERTYYLEHTAPNLSSDFFVWNAPRDFEGVQRVWDVRPYWINMPADVQQALLTGRELTEEYPFGAYTVRLYEAPPATEPITFDGKLALHVTPLERSTFTPGEIIRIKTWWQALETLALDYSYGLYLRDTNGRLVTQIDSGLTLDNHPTSQWQPLAGFELSYFTLQLPDNLPSGEYGVWLADYYWENPQPLVATAPEDFHVDTSVVRLAQITVSS